MIVKYGIYANIFAEKEWVAFAFAKATHIFFSKNTCELDTVFTRTVNILITKQLVKLTMLWTTGPSKFWLKKHLIWWLSWMRRPTGDQEVAGSTPAEVGIILSWRLIMKYFLRSFSPFRWFKKGSCQFLAKECAQYWLTA